MGSDIKPSLPFVCEHGKRGSTLGPFLMTFDQESSTVKKEPEYETKVVKSRSQLNWEKKQASE